MKLTDKYQPAQLLAATWDLYDQCSEAIGVVLDNRFKDPQVLVSAVYEHERHSPEELFKHAATLGGEPFEPIAAPPDLSKEEKEVLSVFMAPEAGRRLNIVGDVGVGKTTFLKHLFALHFGDSAFVSTHPIYIDFANFNASAGTAVSRIEDKFVTTVWSTLEKLFGSAEIAKLDDAIFETAPIFSGDRLLVNRQGIEPHEKSLRITAALTEATKSKRIELTYARINHICKDDVNRLVLIVDNIDHLSEEILKKLGEFLIQAQLDLAPLLVVAMRDHTFNSGFSAYRPDKTVMCWHQRLNPPNLRTMLERRVEHFFPSSKFGESPQTVAIGAGVLRVDREKRKVIRALLTSPLSSQKTYEFLCAYTNYNLRDLFGNLQRIVGFHGYRGYSKELLMKEDARFDIGIDECLISLALGPYLMFFPDSSPVFNPYSSGDDTGPLDRIVAARILQLLEHRTTWINYKELIAILAGWGYSLPAIKAQMAAMANKDIVWTSTGAPENLNEQSGIRLSYRGQLYSRKILQRTVFNYMMSFNVEAPSEQHQVFRHYKSEIMTELRQFANFGAEFESDTLAFRVLGLADIIFEVELLEIRSLAAKDRMDGFRVSVGPRPISIGILEGLTTFLDRVHEKNGEVLRFMPPATGTLRMVGDSLRRYREQLCPAFSD